MWHMAFWVERRFIWVAIDKDSGDWQKLWTEPPFSVMQPLDQQNVLFPSTDAKENVFEQNITVLFCIILIQPASEPI